MLNIMHRLSQHRPCVPRTQAFKTLTRYCQTNAALRTLPCQACLDGRSIWCCARENCHPPASDALLLGGLPSTRSQIQSCTIVSYSTWLETANKLQRPHSGPSCAWSSVLRPSEYSKPLSLSPTSRNRTYERPQVCRQAKLRPEIAT